MKRIFISIQNSLLSAAITRCLKDLEECSISSTAEDADIVLMEVTHTAHTTLDERLLEGEQIRLLVPGCKIVLLCDEHVSPDIAREVVEAKKSGRIDAFYYSSVTGKYLVAALYAL